MSQNRYQSSSRPTPVCEKKMLVATYGCRVAGLLARYTSCKWTVLALPCLAGLEITFTFLTICFYSSERFANQFKLFPTKLLVRKSRVYPFLLLHECSHLISYFLSAKWRLLGCLDVWFANLFFATRAARHTTMLGQQPWAGVSVSGAYFLFICPLLGQKNTTELTKGD